MNRKTTLPWTRLSIALAGLPLLQPLPALGRVALFVTDGHLPYPYGRETTGYEVPNVAQTLAKAKSAGSNVLVASYTSEGRRAAIVQFPGGYVPEIHKIIAK